MNFILHGLKSILDYIHMFFFSTPAFTHIFKILFIAHVVFLIFTAFRPSKRKWIALFISLALYLSGGAGVASLGHIQNHIGLFGFGVMYMIVALILFFATISVWCRTSVPNGKSASQ